MLPHLQRKKESKPVAEEKPADAAPDDESDASDDETP
jgi:hypothetical protein